ncbi:uncharacterized protein LOC136714078 [Amia ocellicauda]|uniref:uncharacterized protein LOC136714078 n=1 Tax=Amia ocellicauda TaxID=2972642 RepID=UPI0034644C96
MSLSGEPEAQDGAMGPETKSVPLERAESPVPSCVSMRSEDSMDHPFHFSKDAFPPDPSAFTQRWLESSDYTAPALQTHRLEDTTADLEPRLCQQHRRALEMFCHTDQSWICSLCAVQEHRSHDTDVDQPCVQAVRKAVTVLSDHPEDFHPAGFLNTETPRTVEDAVETGTSGSSPLFSFIKSQNGGNVVAPQIHNSTITGSIHIHVNSCDPPTNKVLMSF